ncbi:hypothetical protein K490DRAFT_53583 [Saccharata proteae CBS 121410]|uniref:Uncharacterized protein n=1 Tax=Saccharata proteae CBS 121410 TaxID=1314787 RepID=A0A9P4M0W0_9PEZI|nr:hypothetical protein K490DRAFT_53583 [Saccharata proteae CBS 121410]
MAFTKVRDLLKRLRHVGKAAHANEGRDVEVSAPENNVETTKDTNGSGSGSDHGEDSLLIPPQRPNSETFDSSSARQSSHMPSTRWPFSQFKVVMYRSGEDLVETSSGDTRSTPTRLRVEKTQYDEEQRRRIENWIEEVAEALAIDQPTT